MNIWKRVTQLSIGQLFKLSLLFLSHPFLILPTLRATKKTMQLCDERFDKSHHKSNQANAFRHALWNILICKNALKVTKNKQKSVFWAQKVGDLYEKVTQNEKMDKAMDLHNNSVGRILFLNLLEKNEEEILSFLAFKTQSSQKANTIADMAKYRNELVYIED
ncbi:hypothetical protein ULMS_02940 [Patiriisocius marinistellae]|uniref:DUF6973 domain-containing protein n=1 Tax=Patiriisocius marinistellae TaxID=2494560 RepID=A0A5J4FXC8_9FLAO|nr:hypothetical protein [Patiriisocius marinistellae]GEQ84786.1 hypothetical protein ULMS_02940 [Patiriisocius marinistellae]